MFKFLIVIACLLFSLSGQAQQSPAPSNSILAALQSEETFLPVDQAFEFDFVQQGNELKLSWQIADGYYLYKDKFKFAAVAVNFSHPQFQPGLAHEDEYFGKTEVYRHQLTLTIPLSQINPDALLKVRFQGCADKGLCYPVVTKEVPLIVSMAASSNTAPVTTEVDTAAISAPVSSQNQLAEQLTAQGNLWTLGLFFVLGLGLAFTPCVFPMYPILTSIIVGQGKQLSSGRAFRLSFAYVQGMAVTYSLLGLVVASMGVQFQAYFQHPVVLFGISALFILLALAMFGVFNLQLPASWQAKVTGLSNDQQSGSIKGALIMGVLSGLVASPCTTAPLTGVLLYIAQSGDLAYGALVLYVLSMGMGLPLLILGSSGGKLLPKPGAWMDLVKAIFGFLLLAVPLVLLERILSDQAMIVLASLWLVSLALFLYQSSQTLLQAWLKTFCWMLATLLLIGTVQLNQYYWFPPSVAQTAAPATDNTAGKFIDIKTSEDLAAQLKLASAEGQYVMLDLFAEWCVACKEFEHITFADPAVKVEMAKLRLLRIDVTAATEQDQQILDQFKVLGLPTLLFFAPNQQEITQSRITGFMPPAQFKQHIAQLIQP